MIGWRPLLLVARRDFVERLKSRAFQISSGLTILLVLATVFAPRFLDTNISDWRIAVVGEDASAVAAMITVLQGGADPVPTSAVPMPSRAAGESLLAAGEVDAVVVAGEAVVVRSDTPRNLATLAAGAATALGLEQRAARLGLTSQQVGELLGLDQMPIISLEGARESTTGGGAETLALFATILLFVSIVTYGQWILIGVIEEKSSRVVEVVVGTVPPRILLAGKVLGIGLLGLIQLIVVAMIAFGALAATGTSTFPDTTGAAVVATALWFLLGFAFYASAYAAAGALVSRQEDAQNAAFPLTLLLVAAYFIAAFSLGGDNPVIRAASLLPPFSPMTMPLRIALGRAGGWELAISYLLMMIAVWALLRLAARIYRGGILRGGGRTRIGDAWRASQG